MIPILGNGITPQETKTQPRQAEHADTRKDIQRHDPDQNRRENNRRTEDENDEQNGEIATLSLGALSIFLENFLKSLENQANTSETTKDQAPPPETTPIPPTEPLRASTRAAMAANAYQCRANAQQKTSLLKNGSVNAAPTIKLDAKEVRTIHAVLDDLKILEEKQIEYIRIERNESFLQSIVAAIAPLKD